MTLKKNLISGLLWIVLLNLLIKPFWILGVDRGVQNAVGAETYGLYFVAFNLAYIFNILLDLGVTNFNVRNIAQHPQLIEKHLSGILSIKILLLGLYLIVTLTMGMILGYESRQFWLLLWLSINQFLNSLITYLRSNFEGLLMFRMDSVLSVLDRILMILICGCLLWRPNAAAFQIEWFVYAQTAAYVFTAAVALVALARQTGLKRLHFSRPFTLSILRQSAPFALLVLLMASYNRLDPILLQRLLPDGVHQAGIYAGAFRLLDALTMIAYLVSVPLLPIYARLTKESNTEEIGSITQMVFAMMMVFSVTIAVTCAFNSQELMQLMYAEHTEASSQVFRILIYGIIPISMTYIFGTLLTANGSLKQLNIMATTTLVVNIGINLLLIPRWEAVGSAWASVIAQSVMALAQMILALKMFYTKHWPRYINLTFFYVILIIGINLLLRTTPMVWEWRMILAIGLAIVIAIGLRLINVKELIKIGFGNNE